MRRGDRSRFPPHHALLEQFVSQIPLELVFRSVLQLLVVAEDDDAQPLKGTGDFICLDTDARVISGRGPDSTTDPSGSNIRRRCSTSSPTIGASSTCERMLASYRGYLQADAYAGFDALYQDGRILEVGCWAHARRKFFEIAEAAPKDTRTAAHEAIDWIARLYAVEGGVADEPPDKKCAIRQAQSAPVLGEFRTWLEGTLRTVLPRSPTAGAIGYALNNWAALTRYPESGILDIDNNACERAMRPVAIGRKNFLFVGSDRGGRAAAVAYSLIQTCKLHHIEPFAYLSDVLRRLPSYPINRVAELLPFRWQPLV